MHSSNFGTWHRRCSIRTSCRQRVNGCTVQSHSPTRNHVYTILVTGRSSVVLRGAGTARETVLATNIQIRKRVPWPLKRVLTHLDLITMPLRSSETPCATFAGSFRGEKRPMGRKDHAVEFRRELPVYLCTPKWGDLLQVLQERTSLATRSFKAQGRWHTAHTGRL